MGDHVGTPKPFWTYIVASGKNGTTYIGHTDNLVERIWQHKTKAFKGFTAKYNCDQLVWCESLQHTTRSLRSRTPTQGMASKLENKTYRANQSRLERSLRHDQHVGLTTASPPLIPTKVGIQERSRSKHGLEAASRDKAH
jgi:predicted GIY-YIG superfamily endonuclease